MSQREVNIFKFRDAVAEICGRYPGFPEKQHALRVESYALPIRHAVCDEFGAAKVGKPVGPHGLTGRGRMRCGVAPATAVPNATIRKFRTVAREGARRLESLVAQRKAQPASKNRKGRA